MTSLLALLLLATPARAEDPPPTGASIRLSVVTDTDAEESPIDASELAELRRELAEARDAAAAAAARAAEVESRLTSSGIAPPEPPAAPEPPAPPPPPPPAPSSSEKVAFGDDLVIGKGEHVRKATVYGGDVLVEGQVDDDVSSYGGDVLVREGAYVGGKARSFGGDVVVENGADVRGGVASLGGAVDVDQEAWVDGDRVSVVPAGRGAIGRAVDQIVFLLSLAGGGLLMVGLFPGRIGRVAATAIAHPIRSGVIGALLVPVALVTALVLIVPVITIPLSFLVVAGVGLALMVGLVGVCQALGDRVPVVNPSAGRWMGFLVGFALLALVSFLPVLGTLTIFLASVLGIGAFATTLLGAEPV